MEKEIKIDKNVPMPMGNRNLKYPLGSLDVGDSFFVENANNQSLGGVFALHKPKKFSVRTLTENGVKGLRVWRVS